MGRPSIWTLERRLRAAGLGPVAGADEAGRGACAGPLVAAAVVLPDNPPRRLAGITDSKLLTPKRREELFDVIQQVARAWVIVSIAPEECDLLGIHEANLSALRRAIWQLDVAPAYALIDGFPVSGLGVPGLAVWKGDQTAACVAAASILAKVTRDRAMIALADVYPGYGFEVHKGYCTKAHQIALEELGPCAIHRQRYENVQRAAARLAAP